MKNEAGIAGDVYPWASWLAECMFNMNMQTSRTTNETPYHLVFGVAPPSHEGVLGSRVLDEEEMDDIDEGTGSEVDAGTTSDAVQISVATDDVDAGTTSEAEHVGEVISVATDDVDAGTTSEAVAMDGVDAGTTSEADEEEPMDLLSMSFMFDDDEDDVTDEGLDIPIEIPSTSASSVNYDGDNTVEEDTVTSIRRAVKRKAQESTEKAAKRYANQYNKRLKVCQDFKEDDTISILIPSK